MIIWINGAFGSGKTQTAYELNKRIVNSHVFDPEETGFYIRDNIPKNILIGDFQGYPMWREFNSKMLEYMSSNYDGVIIVPMTVTNKVYMEELLTHINTQEHKICYFTLTVSASTLLNRLKRRGDGKNSWAANQIERCVQALSDDYFKEHIGTDKMTIDEVVEDIATRCHIELINDNRSQVKKKIDRLIVWKKNIRLFNFS